MGRTRRLLMLGLAVFVVAGLSAPVAVAGTGVTSGWVHEGRDPAALLTAVETNQAKLPIEFEERLRYELPDGTLQVMVSLTYRDADVERFVEDATTWLRWYGDSPRFWARVTQEQMTALLDSPAVSFVEPDYQISNFMSSSTVDIRARSLAGDGSGVWSFDPATGEHGALRSDVSGLEVGRATGRGVTVAITDSGIDKTHRDFGAFSCVPTAFQPCESRIKRSVSLDHLVGGVEPAAGFPVTSEAASGHGTHVAGTIAGNGFYTRDGDEDAARYGGDGYVMGVAPEASLVSVKNGDSQWAGLSTMALQWTLDNAEEYGIRVSSNSWGCLGGCSFNGSSAFAGVLRDLYREDVVVTFAVGNDAGGGDGVKFSGNAQSPYVLGVAAYDDSNARLASFSSRGVSSTTLASADTWTPESEAANGVRRPDIAAPGVSIWSARTLTGGTSSLAPRANTNDVVGGGSSGTVPYVTMSGTSMATPHVAGAAALLFGACPTASALDVMRSIMVAADGAKVLKTDGSRSAEPWEAGYGALNVRASLNSLMAQPACGGSTPAEDPQPENSSPVAVADAATTNEDTAVAVDVIANDSDPDGDSVAVTTTSEPGHGTVFVEGGTITYTPAAGFYETDTFDYTIDDGRGGTSTATVTIDVNGRPRGTDDSAEAKKKESVSMNVVANDTDPEEDALTLTSYTKPEHGSLTCDETGSCTYGADGKHKGEVTFTYVVCDAAGACDDVSVKITLG